MRRYSATAVLQAIKGASCRNVNVSECKPYVCIYITLLVCDNDYHNECKKRMKRNHDDVDDDDGFIAVVVNNGYFIAVLHVCCISCAI